MKYFMMLFVLMLSLAGCSNDDSDEHLIEQKKVEQQNIDKQKTVFDSQLKALEKAKNVEHLLQKSADQRQRELDSL